MAKRDDNWSSFMQSRPVRIILNAVCTVFSAIYGVTAALELANPPASSQQLIEAIGQTGYIAITVGRCLVCLWVAFVFGRMTIKLIQEKDDE